MAGKNTLLVLTLAGLLVGAWGCDGSGMSEKGNGANGGATGTGDSLGGKGTGIQGTGGKGADGQDADGVAQTSGPTQAFEVSFDGLTVESYFGSEPGSSYVQFKDGDKVLLKEVFDGLDCPPKLIYADNAEGPEHLPIRLAKDDVKAVIVGFSRDNAEFARIYKVSLPQDSKDKTVRQVSRLAQIEHSCALVPTSPEQTSPQQTSSQQTSSQQTSPQQYDLSVEIPSRFNGARRVMLDITLCIESSKVVVDQKAMKAEVPDASKISDFIAEASAAFSEKEEIKALIKAQAKRQKLGNSDEKSDAEAYANDPLAIVPPELADGVLHCIYAGRLDLGRKILDAAWPSGLSGKQKYWRALCAEASKGPYGEQIRLLNKGRGKFPS